MRGERTNEREERSRQKEYGGGVVAGGSAAGGVKIAAAIHSETDCSGGKEASLPADMIVSNRISVKGAPSLRFSVRDYRN